MHLRSLMLASLACVGFMPLFAIAEEGGGSTGGGEDAPEPTTETVNVETVEGDLHVASPDSPSGEKSESGDEALNDEDDDTSDDDDDDQHD